MKTKILIGFIALSIAALGFYKLTTVIPENATIKIGAVLPLTGDMATYGEGMRNAINLAVVQSGNQGKVKIIFENDHDCTVKDDVGAAQKLITVDKVDAIIGAVCSSATLGIAPITEKAHLIVISPSSSSKSITDAGKYVFRTIASDSDKTVAVANFAYDKGYKKAAILIDASGDAFVQERLDVKKTFEDRGGLVVLDDSFVAKTTDFRTQLAKIKVANPDVIFLGSLPTEAGLVLKQANELGLHIPVIATDTTTGTKEALDIAGNASEGLVFPFAVTPTNKESNQFIQDYKQQYGKEPAAYSAEAYDAAILLLQSISKNNQTSDDIAGKLMKNGNNYNGASGVITFDKNGDVQKPLIIKQVKNSEFVTVK